jgi:TetR/AcrR family transcriptional regulator, transcriptional repressor for nem operon
MPVRRSILLSKMTDSLPAIPGRQHRTQGAQSAQSGKRERLIGAAAATIYAAGVEKTTLADIAAAAGIPLGNVYYYFKTKNALVEAVIEAHLTETRAILAAIDDAHEAPGDRLKALFGTLAAQGELIARYGCPHGSLCLELDKRAEGPGLAAEMMRVPLDWTERQFRAAGRQDARDLAVQLVARYQGTALLANTFRDPDLMAADGRRVAGWVDALITA